MLIDILVLVLENMVYLLYLVLWIKPQKLQCYVFSLFVWLLSTDQMMSIYLILLSPLGIDVGISTHSRFFLGALDFSLPNLFTRFKHSIWFTIVALIYKQTPTHHYDLSMKPTNMIWQVFSCHMCKSKIHHTLLKHHPSDSWVYAKWIYHVHVVSVGN